MKLTLQKAAWSAIGLFALISAIWLDYYLPEKTITTITGVEVKRVDKDGPIGRENPADGPTTDVYYIYTSQPDDEVRVFRNEDTRWSWPWYFKFNSADVQAKAKTLELLGRRPSQTIPQAQATCRQPFMSIPCARPSKRVSS